MSAGTDRERGVYCSEVNGRHTLETEKIALTSGTTDMNTGEKEFFPVIHFLRLDGYGWGMELIIPAPAIVLTHETAHVLGMYEAYDDNPNHSTDSDMDCIMDKINEKMRIYFTQT